MTAVKSVGTWETKLLELKRRILEVSRFEDRLYHELVIARPGLPGVEVENVLNQLPSRVHGELLRYWRIERPCGSLEYHCFFGPDGHTLDVYGECLGGVHAILKQLPLELYPQDYAVKNLRTCDVSLVKWQRLLNFLAAVRSTHLLPFEIVCADDRDGQLGDFAGCRDREFAAGFDIANYIFGKKGAASAEYHYWRKRHDDEGLLFPAIISSHWYKHAFYSTANAIDTLLIMAREPMAQTPRRQTRRRSDQQAQSMAQEEVLIVELLNAHHQTGDSRSDAPMSRDAMLEKLTVKSELHWNPTRVTRAMKRVFCLPGAGTPGFRQYWAICEMGEVGRFLRKRSRDGKLLELKELKLELADGTRSQDQGSEAINEGEDDDVDRDQYWENGRRVAARW